jgi:hypothetical protein
VITLVSDWFRNGHVSHFRPMRYEETSASGEMFLFFFSDHNLVLIPLCVFCVVAVGFELRVSLLLGRHS